LELIKSSGDSLLIIINDILDISKLEEGKIEVEEQPFSIMATVNETIKLLGHKAQEKGIELKLDCPEITHHHLGDVVRIKQIIINIIGNAIKFTEKGHVQLEVREKSDQIFLFTIKDSGIGMTKEQCSRLFQRFEQAESSTTRKFGGTGLGLAISKKLVELMGGEIHVKSKPGNGSVFQVKLPLKRSTKKASKKHKEMELIQQLSKNNTISQKSILVVDDNPINLKVAQITLEKMGVKVFKAKSGFEAIEIVLEGAPIDLILLDSSMPEMDGNETARRLRKTSEGKTIPIICFSANAMENQIKENLEAGMDGFLSKPIQKEKLAEVLMKHLPK
jgi:CheY-like chemotaxis protein